MAITPVKFKYSFEFSNGRLKEFQLELDPKTLALNDAVSMDDGRSVPLDPESENREWTQLEYQQCPHCPLKKEQSPRCPIAHNLALVAESFKDVKSYEPVRVQVVAEPRTYLKQLSLQEGLHGIFGLIMATSGCPHLDFLKPMARFHLPFSTYEETIVRAVSFYLLRQYLKQKKGKGVADFELKDLEAAYQAVETVNLGIIERIKAIAAGDADANSVVILDGYAKLLGIEISSGLNDVDRLFPDPPPAAPSA